MARHQVGVAGVTIDWDEAKHPVLNAKEGRIKPTRDKANIRKGDGDEFTPEQIIVDLKLDLGDSSVTSVNLDDVHLKVSYQGRQPTIGWWNGNRWVKFKTVTYTGNLADVTLPSPWPTDPPIGTAP